MVLVGVAVVVGIGLGVRASRRRRSQRSRPPAETAGQVIESVDGERQGVDPGPGTPQDAVAEDVRRPGDDTDDIDDTDDVATPPSGERLVPAQPDPRATTDRLPVHGSEGSPPPTHGDDPDLPTRVLPAIDMEDVRSVRRARRGNGSPDAPSRPGERGPQHRSPEEPVAVPSGRHRAPAEPAIAEPPWQHPPTEQAVAEPPLQHLPTAPAVADPPSQHLPTGSFVADPASQHLPTDPHGVVTIPAARRPEEAMRPNHAPPEPAPPVAPPSPPPAPVLGPGPVAASGPAPVVDGPPAPDDDVSSEPTTALPVSRAGGHGETVDRGRRLGRRPPKRTVADRLRGRHR